MQLVCQASAVQELNQLALNNSHSILIEGPVGCGKTYLAKQYANMLQVPDFQIISPDVQSVREAVEGCMTLDTPIVICIENLDTGVSAAAYALLKFLEEPTSNVYIVVTCTNINHVPDTIISRSAIVTACAPIDSDIAVYAETKNFDRYYQLKDSKLWACVRTFKDVDIVLAMNPAQISYFEKLEGLVSFKDTISNIVWKLGHYEDNSETPIDLVIRYIIGICNSPFIQRSGIDCITELSSGRVAAHATLAKFAFNCKYCE